MPIHKEIMDADICIADISEKNPNVWYEVGFAIGRKKELILISKKQLKYPFDVSHRKVIEYTTECPKDFIDLGKNIKETIIALMNKKSDFEKIINQPLAEFNHTLADRELIVLVSILNNQNALEYASSWSINDDMEKADFIKAAASLAIVKLFEKKFVDKKIFIQKDSFSEDYEEACYKITAAGLDWLIKNESRLNLNK